MERGKTLKDVIIRPLMTEKVVSLEQTSKYSFLVRYWANKVMVRKAVEAIYGVKVRNVNMLTVKTKKVMRRRGVGTKGLKAKKAIVSLKKGDSLKKSK